MPPTKVLLVDDAVVLGLKEILKDVGNGHFGNHLEGTDFEVEEYSDWAQDYKYLHLTYIVKHAPSGRCFEVMQSRSGSPFTDWCYDDPDLGREVVKVTKTITREVWKAAQ